MNEFRIFLRKEKIKWLYKMHEDFYKETGIVLPHGHGFTISDFCHFLIHDGKKFVHKDAMRFVLTNGGTYSAHEKLLETFIFNSSEKARLKIDNEVERMFDFYRLEINQIKLFPNLLKETEHFFVFEYYPESEWTQLLELTKEDSDYIRKVFLDFNRNKKEVVTPFNNQLLNKFFRNNKTKELVMVDLKCLEFHPKAPLSILMKNNYINDLYLLERRYWTRAYILKPYTMDYDVSRTRLIKHY